MSNFYRLSFFSILFGFVSALMDWRLIVSQILGEQLHRHQWENTINEAINYKGVIILGLEQIFREGLQQVLLGHYHMWVGFYSAVAAVLVFVISGKWNKITFLVLGFVLLCSFLSLVKDVELGHRIATVIPIHRINPRFNTVIPGLLVVLASLSYFAIKSKGMRAALILVFLVNGIISAMGLSYVSTDLRGSHFAENLFATTFMSEKNNTHKAWDEFYLTNDFNSLKAKGIDTGAAFACVNLYPEIARYHGFKTLGVYLPTIDLRAYHNFLSFSPGFKSTTVSKNYSSRAYLNLGKGDLYCHFEQLTMIGVSYILLVPSSITDLENFQKSIVYQGDHLLVIGVR